MNHSEQNHLYSRIAALNRNEPYVWKLSITEAEFERLENAVRMESKETLLGGAWALRTAVYMAEWYKRRYDGGTARPAVDLNSEELAVLWTNSGINRNVCLYTMENGSRSWRYSLYVLGGLAIPFELGKKDTGYLKELCRLYHGENDRLDNLDEADRAAAFRQSISNHGSLYEYLRNILNGEMPFAKEDLKNPESDVNRFIQRIRTANDEVLRSKFRLEWRIVFSPENPWMIRCLYLHLKPEEVGGGLQQYLRYDRVSLWGIAHPERQKTLHVCVRFLDKDRIVAPVNPQKPLLTYSNTGCAETGFLAWNTRKYAVMTDVPRETFTTAEIVILDDKGKEHIAESVPVCEWMQLFRLGAYDDEWSSNQQLQQRETALVCSSKCTLLDVGENEQIYRPVLREHGDDRNDFYYWRYINDSVRFTDSAGREHTLYNRQGYDQITVKLHHDILRYTTAGMVRCLARNEEEDDETETQVPLLLSKDELLIRHFHTRNDLEDTRFETETSPDKLEVKLGAKYSEWTDEVVPEQGFLKLRITVKGREYLYPVYYLPKKIERDFRNRSIVIGDKVYPDQITMSGTPLQPVRKFSEETPDAKVYLEIWRPTLHKELIRNGKVVRYVQDGERTPLPYLFKDDVEIQDFNRTGYRKYGCRDLSSIYNLPGFTPQIKSNIKSLKEAKAVPATDLDPYAPEWLDVCLSVPKDENLSKAVFYQWNYFADENPQPTKQLTGCPDNEIIFQRPGKGLELYPYTLGSYDTWEYQEEKISVFRCFEIAMEYHLYFFAMLPLRESLKDYANELYLPLLEKRGGNLTEEDRKSLKRFAEEFGFSWENYHITLE